MSHVMARTALLSLVMSLGFHSGISNRSMANPRHGFCPCVLDHYNFSGIY